MSWRDNFNGYPYARPTPGMPFYPESIPDFLSGVHGFPPVAGMQQLGVPFSQSPRGLPTAGGYPVVGNYLPALSREASIRALIRPPSSVYLPTSISPALASGLLQATARNISSSQLSSLYGSLLLGLGSTVNSSSHRNAPEIMSPVLQETGLARHLPPPPPLKQAPVSKNTNSTPSSSGSQKTFGSNFPGWHRAVTSTDRLSPPSTAAEDADASVTSSAYSWHRPVMSSSNETPTHESAEAADIGADEELKQYRRVGDKFSCIQCSYTSSKVEKMRQHIDAHSGGKICQLCGKAFVKQCDLMRHVHAHTKDSFSIWESSVTNGSLRPDHISILDETYDSSSPVLGSTTAYNVPPTTEPSEAVFRVLRPLGGQPPQTASTATFLERCQASTEDSGGGRKLENDVGNLKRNKTKETKHLSTSFPVNGSSDGTNDLAGDETLGIEALRKGPSSCIDATMTKSILEEILSDIVQRENKVVQDGCSGSEYPPLDGRPDGDGTGSGGDSAFIQTMNNNNNSTTGEWKSKDSPKAGIGTAPSGSFCQPRPVTDTDILLALYGESLKKVPATKNEDCLRKASLSDLETDKNRKVADSAVSCDDSEENNKDDDDDDDDDENDDDDSDGIASRIIKKSQTSVDADESTVDSCDMENASSKIKPSSRITDTSLESSVIQQGVSHLQIDDIQSCRSKAGELGANKQCDSSNETGQSSTDVDSVLDSAIALPEYASVGGNIIDLSARQEPKADEQYLDATTFLPVAPDPSLLGIHTSPESLLASASSVSPRLHPGSGFRCGICNYEGRSEKSLQKHLRAHSSSYKICRYCSKAFERPSDLARHEERHERNMVKTGGDPSLISKGQILGINGAELGAAHSDTIEHEFRCKRCDFVTNRYHKLALHKRQKHSVKHCCKYCPMFFISALPLNNHMKRCPMKPPDADDGNSMDRERAGTSTPTSSLQLAELIADKSVWNLTTTAACQSPMDEIIGGGHSLMVDDGRDLPTAISGIGRLDSFKKDVLFKSVLFEVELGGEDNELVLSISDVADDLMDQMAGDIPHCSDPKQAGLLRAGQWCVTDGDQALGPSSVHGHMPKVPSPFRIDRTSPPPTLDRLCHVTGKSSNSQIKYSSLEDVLSDETTSGISGSSPTTVTTCAVTPLSSIITPASTYVTMPTSRESTTRTLEQSDSKVHEHHPADVPEECTTVQSQSAIRSLESSPTPANAEEGLSKNRAATIESARKPDDSLDIVPALPKPELTPAVSATAITTTATTTISSAAEPSADVRSSTTCSTSSDQASIVPTSLREILSGDYSSSTLPPVTPIGRTTPPSSSNDGVRVSEYSNIPLTVQELGGVQSTLTKYPVLGEQLGKPVVSLPVLVINIGGENVNRASPVVKADSKVSETDAEQISGSGRRSSSPIVLASDEQKSPPSSDTSLRQSAVQMMRPNALRHKPTRYYCQRCNYGTHMKQKMDVHMKAHGGRFICKHCNKACIKASDLYRHWVTHNLMNDDGDYVCDTCDFASPSKHIVMNHLRVHYLIKRTPFPESHNITRCGLCGKSFTRSQLFVHKRMIHGAGRRSSTETAPNGDDSETPHQAGPAEWEASGEKKQVFRCPACNKSFESQTRVNSHYEESHMKENGSGGGRGQLECVQCGRCFNSKRQLVCHQRSHYASARNHRHHNVRVHQLTNGHRKKYRCPYCGKRFRGRYYLAHHKKLHTGEKPYQCMKCGEKFALSQACQNHIKRGCPARRERHHVLISTCLDHDDKDVMITEILPPPAAEIVKD